MSDVSPETEALLAQLRTAGAQIIATKSLFIAMYALVLYDHTLTFSDEIKYIWKRQLSTVSVLFFITRYYALGAFTVVLASFFSPLFHPEPSMLITQRQSSCSHFATFFPFAVGIPLTIMPGIIMGLRVVALYKNSKITQFIVGGYLFAELCVGLWVYSVPGSHPLALPTIVHGDAFTLCTDLASDSLGNIKSATFQFMETVYDTVILVLVILKTAESANITSLRESITFLITTQSLVYFAIIFSSNLLWALMIILAPTGLKYATAIPTIMLVCNMVNRLTLDLRAFFIQDSTPTQRLETQTIPTFMQRARSRVTLRFTSPSRTMLSTTFSAIETEALDRGRGGDGQMELATISEASHSMGKQSSEMEEYEMQRIRQDASHTGRMA